jgi:dihydrolipoamide dehydrogenase
VRIELAADVTAIERVPGGVRVHYQQGGAPLTVDGDAVLMATGRESVLPEGSETLDLPAHRPVVVDSQLRTHLPHVYAPGDVNGRSMLFHSAVRQSLVVAHNILAGGQAADRMNFLSVPFTVFTEPEIAWVGLTETQARAQFGDVQAVRYSYAVDARAQIYDEPQGFITLVFDDRTTRLLGAQVAGMDAAHLIAPLALAVQEASTAATLSEVPFPHPMISEGINRATARFRV